MTKGYFKITTLAKYSDLSRSTIQKILKGGRVPYVKLDGVILIAKNDWDDFMNANKVASRKDKARAIAEEMLTQCLISPT